MRHTLLLAATALALATSALAGEVTVTLDGVEPRGGTLYVALQNSDQFMRDAGLSRVIKAPDTSGPIVITFPNVPAGDYALSALHDADNNKRMSMGADSMPVEGWAMSGAQALRARPTFADVKVTVPAAGGSIAASMQYPGAAPR